MKSLSFLGLGDTSLIPGSEPCSPISLELSEEEVHGVSRHEEKRLCALGELPWVDVHGGCVFQLRKWKETLIPLMGPVRRSYHVCFVRGSGAGAMARPVGVWILVPLFFTV